MSEPSAAWLGALRAAGHHPGEVLGAGMEGTVVALEDDRVAKLWQRRTREELDRLRTFYDAVGRAGLPVATPAIEDVVVHDGRCASIEPRLTGTPLWRPTGEEQPAPTDAQLAVVVEVLAALAGTEATPAMSALPVLEGEAAFDPATTFEESLAALVVRRARTSHAALARELPDLDDLVEAVVGSLRALVPARATLVHGDLIPANILVEGGRPTALLDFGFLSTGGDPAFDAAVAASIFDMYGPGAAATEARLDAAIAARLGHDPRRLGVHRAAYALVTATCFSASGRDGHFAWCVRMLRRDDVRAAIGR